MNKVISVVGARPNFMKVAPVHKAFKKYSSEIEHMICHTGQHYDEKMSKVFFDELELPKPDFYLGVGSASHAEQTAKVMIEFEKVLIKEKPDMVVVFGDVNSTVACSLTAIKLGIKVSHVEAGLRSFDRTMPEEINRLLTDQISDYLFVTEESGIKNLKNEGISNGKVFLTGNVMIDSLVHYLPKADQSDILQCYGLKEKGYVLVTLHRPSNVDSKEYLRELIELLNVISNERKLIFPIHPRTKNNMKSFNLDGLLGSNVVLTDPVGYIDFLCLTKNSELIITDSGGIQEESTYLGVQCLTVRNNTERPVTVEMGTNQLIGTDLKRVELAALDILCGNKKSGTVPPLWDGHASDRITEIVADKLK
ncbi:MAG: UDP-N-acetylglucosamine 2-epimerase (non-hydrolyzing) [Bacteroidota bacterium]|nr:UDP-N-acetylglucosamine 2-epimerase (non-hydrolyzing) [Bacteroidota bacterium]